MDPSCLAHCLTDSERSQFEEQGSSVGGECGLAPGQHAGERRNRDESPSASVDQGLLLRPRHVGARPTATRCRTGLARARRSRRAGGWPLESAQRLHKSRAGAGCRHHQKQYERIGRAALCRQQVDELTLSARSIQFAASPDPKSSSRWFDPSLRTRSSDRVHGLERDLPGGVHHPARFGVVQFAE